MDHELRKDPKKLVSRMIRELKKFTIFMEEAAEHVEDMSVLLKAFPPLHTQESQVLPECARQSDNAPRAELTQLHNR